MNAVLRIVLGAAPFALAVALWFTPAPAGLAPAAWHLFAVFAAAIASVVIGVLPLLTASALAVANELAARLQCDRVTVGIEERDRERHQPVAPGTSMIVMSSDRKRYFRSRTSWMTVLVLPVSVCGVP